MNARADEEKVQTELTLAELRIGETAIIERYLGNGDLQGRLKELGLVRGTKIVINRYAPLGDPLEIRVRGYHLAIRENDAAQIVVSKAQASR